MHARRLLWAFALPLLATACKDEPEAIPAYIEIKPFTVNAGGDAGWHKITDGWLYVNGEFLGAYTLPDTVPVLASGESQIQLFPGVKKNGILETPDIYPFLKRHVAQMDLVPGEVRSITPSTEYEDDVIFPWDISKGSFDAGSKVVFENRDGDSANSYEFTSDGAFAGNCLLMRVDTAHQLMDIASEAVILPATLAQEVWLEMQYKNDVPFYLYIIGNINGVEEVEPLYLFNSRGDGQWNKIYLNLSETLISLTDAVAYRLYFRLALPNDTSGNPAQESGEVRLDNIRLLHF